MDEQGITRAMVEAVVSAPVPTVRGDTADEYRAAVDGRPLRVVLTAGSDPRLVITAYWIGE
jgi:hypothetical protein